MTGRLLCVFFSCLISQVICAPPQLVNPTTNTDGVNSELVLEAAANGDTLVKTPEPLQLDDTMLNNVFPSSTTTTTTTTSATPEYNDNAQMAQTNIPTTTPTMPSSQPLNTPNGNTSPPQLSTSVNPDTFDSPVNQDLAQYQETGLPPFPNPVAPIQMLMCQLRRLEMINTIFSSALSGRLPGATYNGRLPYSSSMPSMPSTPSMSSMPSMPSIPGVNMINQLLNPATYASLLTPNLNDPSLKLVNEQKINDGPLRAEAQQYVGQPDPNTQTKMQTANYEYNGDGVQGSGQRIASQTHSSYSGPASTMPTMPWTSLLPTIPRGMQLTMPDLRFY